MIRTAIVVAPSPVPLVLGGAERHWETLCRSMQDAGIATDLVKLPVRERTLLDLVDGYEAFRLLDLSHADLVVSGKYPAWMVQHPNHVLWMLHPLRGLYDTYNPAAHEALRPPDTASFEDLVAMVERGASATDPLELIDLVRAASEDLGPEESEPGGALAIPSPMARAVVHLLDDWALRPSRVARHLAISEVVAQRPGYFPAGIVPEVVVPPSCLADPEPSPPGAGLLCVGRLDAPKRVELVIEAFSRIEDPAATLSILGDGPMRGQLAAMVEGDPRVTMAGRVSDDDLAEHYRRCAAVMVAPLDEDFGYVAIEAMQAGRALITTTDSGGPAGLATDGVDAIVVEPTGAALADAGRLLLADRDLARSLGAAGRVAAARHAWPRAVERLVAPREPRPVAEGRRGRVVAVSTYPIADWPGGGPERARHLLAGLAESGWEVEVVAIAPQHTAHRAKVLDGLSETSVELSQRHVEAEKRLRRLTANMAVTDIAASVLWPASPDLVRGLGRALEDADVAVAVQPYLAPAVLALAADVALVLDDHNHERALKSQMLPDDEAGAWMLARVADAEGAAARNALLVVATTAEDARGLEAEHGLTSGSVHVVPNGVDLDAVRYTPPEQRAVLREELLGSLEPAAGSSHVALFVGSAHRPNIDAAREIIHLAGGFPHVVFALAGEHSDQIDIREAPPNVRLLGHIGEPRLAELLAGADVALNPMRTGGGSNLKVLDFFAAGVPVLSTPLGVRGIAHADRYAVVARVDHLGASLQEMLAESPPRSSGGRVEAARELVEQEFDWSVIAERFARLLEDSVGPRERLD